MNTPVACSLRVAAFLLAGGAASGLAKPVPRRPLALHRVQSTKAATQSLKERPDKGKA